MEGNYKAELREDARVSQNALVITNSVLDARRSIKKVTSVRMQGFRQIVSSQREADLQNEKRSVYIVRRVCVMTLHCELLLTFAKQTRPVLAHVTPDSRLRSALPPALLAQLLFPMGVACWKSWLHEVPANQFERRFGTHLHPIFLCSAREVTPKVHFAKLYLDSHLSESDWCGLVVQFGPVYAQNLAKKL
jgi:hypothetical protein